MDNITIARTTPTEDGCPARRPGLEIRELDDIWVGTNGKLKHQYWDGTEAKSVPGFDTWNVSRDVNEPVPPSDPAPEGFTVDIYVVQLKRL
ncbi:hypothetical protein HJFPF1_07245 [Paramyrothecium foliicola]|nr:hypothetical protein HJFPF1_07245 [Paramyrothecium foliicola]